MAIRISKPAINLKDKLSQLDRPVGTTGARLLATSTSDEVFSLLTSGNVGIGTSPAVAKLQVTTTSNTGNVFTWSNGQFLISPGGTATSQGLGFSVNTADASASLSSLTPGSSWNTMRYRAITHVFMESDTTRLIITNTGNVGIATTNPGTTLDVNGSIRSNTQVNVNNSSSFYIPYAAGDTGAGTDEKYWRIAQLDRTNKTLSLGVAQNDGSTEAYSSIGIIRSSARISKISLFTDNNQERLSVDINGRISAGLALGSYTSYVTPRLLVNCESATDASSVIIGESALGTAHPTISFHRRTGVTANQTYGYRLVEFLGDLQFQSAPAQLPGGHVWTERVTFTAGGNVGIGTTNPAERFSLWSSGTLARFSSTGTYGDIIFTNTYAGGTVHYIGCYDASLRFYANSGSVPTMTISGGSPGNVGIGTTNPTSTTDIWGLQTNTSATSASLPSGTLRLAFNGGENVGNYGASLVFSQKWFSNTPEQVATGQIAGFKSANNGNYGGGLAFFTSDGQQNFLSERLRLDSAGNANIINGNLVIGTSGKGIDFSAHTNAAGMTNELLDDYEEGTWTPTLTNGGTLTVVEATYTKIGRLVSIYAYVNNVAPTNNTSVFVIGGLPFTNKSGSAFHCGSIGFAGSGNLNDWRPLVDVNSTSVYFHVVSGSNLRRTNANYVTLNNNGELLFNVTYNIR